MSSTCQGGEPSARLIAVINTVSRSNWRVFGIVDRSNEVKQLNMGLMTA